LRYFKNSLVHVISNFALETMLFPILTSFEIAQNR
jgi:hypothetical protein